MNAVEPRPDFVAKVMQRVALHGASAVPLRPVSSQASASTYDRLSRFLTQPRFALAVLTMFVAVNAVGVITRTTTRQSGKEAGVSTTESQPTGRRTSSPVAQEEYQRALKSLAQEYGMNEPVSLIGEDGND